MKIIIQQAKIGFKNQIINYRILKINIKGFFSASNKLTKEKKIYYINKPILSLKINESIKILEELILEDISKIVENHQTNSNFFKTFISDYYTWLEKKYKKINIMIL